MQGASLDNAFFPFGSWYGDSTGVSDQSYRTNSNSEVSLNTRILQSSRQVDISGSTLLDLEKEKYLQSISEIPILPLEPGSQQSQIIMENYKSLKHTHKSLLNELELIEKQIQSIENTGKNVGVAIEDYTHQLLHSGVLSNDEFSKLQQHQQEMKNIHSEYQTKCIGFYKKRVWELSSKLENVQMNLASYIEFIKAGIHEMMGSDIKKNTCAICLESEVDHCLVPCGHTYCGNCIQKSANNNCMLCRAHIQKKMKLYLAI